MSTENKHQEHRETSRWSLSPETLELLREKRNGLPEWVRANKAGPEHYTGLSRSYLYQLAQEGMIRSVSIRRPGQIRGVRLFNLPSILAFIESKEAGQ